MKIYQKRGWYGNIIKLLMQGESLGFKTKQWQEYSQAINAILGEVNE